MIGGRVYEFVRVLVSGRVRVVVFVPETVTVWVRLAVC